MIRKEIQRKIHTGMGVHRHRDFTKKELRSLLKVARGNLSRVPLNKGKFIPRGGSWLKPDLRISRLKVL